MAHRPKPFFRSGRGWYVQLGKQQIKLADGPQNAESETAAWDAFHTLMAEKKSAAPEPIAQGLCVAEVFDKFLGWSKKHNAPRTYEWYHDHIQSFINHNGEIARSVYTAIKPFHVIEWVDSHGDAWSPAYRRGAIIAIQRAFNLCEELGYIPASPIKRIHKPQPQRRENHVTPEVWEKIKSHYQAGDPFRELLEFAWETGLRPHEVKILEPRHLFFERHSAMIPPDEAKGKKRWRIIRMSPRAEEIIKAQMNANPEGVIFRNEDGQPWTKSAMSCRFLRLKKHLGTKYACVDFRHGFAQDMLEQGNDPLTVSELLGHADGRMLATTYSHMNKAHSHVERALNNRKTHGREM